MTVTEVRKEVESARSAAVAAGHDEIVARLDRVLADLGGELLFTIAETATRLGIRSTTTVKAMVHAGQITVHRIGSESMIPLSEVERLERDEGIQRLIAADRIHDESGMLGAPDGMAQEEMDVLSQTRPGSVPWQRRY